MECAEKESLAEWIAETIDSRELVPGFSDVYFCPVLANDLSQVILALLDAESGGLYQSSVVNA